MAQQKFRIVPRDLQVLEGTEALLRCEIYNLVGAVQWTKDGFALGKERGEKKTRPSVRLPVALTDRLTLPPVSPAGFSHTIPGYPRYSVLADRNQGIYNLRISNASIEDDAEYQCQVGPAKFNSAIRANARLTVICKYYPGFNFSASFYYHHPSVCVPITSSAVLLR